MSAVLNVVQGFYYLTDIGRAPSPDRSADSEEEYGYGSGLLYLDGMGIVVLTGTRFGPIKLGVDVHEREPDLSLAGWSEVVEVSRNAWSGAVAPLEPFVGEQPDLPVLRLAPGSWYRARVHARGRDEARLQGGSYERLRAGIVEPAEEHLVQLWPAPRAPEVRHKLMDQEGEIRRRQEAEIARAKAARGEGGPAS